MLTLEKICEKLHAKLVCDTVGSDAAATCPAALGFGHAFYGALVLAHAHARVRLIAVDLVVLAWFGVEGSGLGVGRELHEFLVSLGGTLCGGGFDTASSDCLGQSWGVDRC